MRLIMEENEVLTKDKGLKENLLPTGRKLGIVLVPGTSLYRIKFVDNKQGDVPQEYSGKYTSRVYAEKDLKDYVESFWTMSESVSQKQQNKKTLSLNQNAVS